MIKKLLFLMSMAVVASAQPVWTDVLNMAGQTNAASGTYYNTGHATVVNTDLLGITPVASTLSMPVTKLTGAAGGLVSCGVTTTYPLSYIESNPGSGIKGVGFLGSFNSPHPLINLFDINGYPANLFQSVFYGDNACYSGGREYGFFLATYDSSIWVYWGTSENLGVPDTQGQLQLPNVYANTQYYFEMYPVVSTGDPGGCALQITVLNSNYSVAYSSNQSVTSSGGGSIIDLDPNFCNYLLQTPPYQENGQVSANFTPGQALSGTLPAQGLNLNMQRIFVGK